MNAPQHEPAVGIGGTISGVLYAAFLVLKASGVEVTDDMSGAVTTLVLALCAIPAVSGFVTRFFVVSPATAESVAVESATANTPDPAHRL